MDSKSSFLLVRIHGIPIRIHATFLLVVPLLTYVFGRSFVEAARLAGTPPEQLAGTPWLWGLALAVALFASVDGGRIRRGALARRLGLARATGVAARLGRAIAILFRGLELRDLAQGEGAADSSRPAR